MMKGLVQLVVGLLFWVIVAYSLTFTSWFAAAWHLLQGGLVWLLFFIGLGLVLLGLSELRS